MGTPHRNSNTFAKARSQAAELFSAPRDKRKDGEKMWAFLGDLKLPQKLDKDGYGVHGFWVLPGRRVVKTAELFEIAKRQGVSLHFTNSEGV